MPPKIPGSQPPSSNEMDLETAQRLMDFLNKQKKQEQSESEEKDLLFRPDPETMMAIGAVPNMTMTGPRNPVSPPPSFMESNPLMKYGRHPSLYIKLPSNGHYNDPDDILFENGEIPIYAQTAADDIILKSPDALMNGTAISKVILSCAPNIKNPTKLTSPDLDCILLAIKTATTGPRMELEGICPECNHINPFDINLEESLERIIFLEKEYIITLKTGLKVYIKPYTSNILNKFALRKFEEEKTLQALDDNTVSVEEKFAIMTRSFEVIAKATEEIISSSIIKIITPDNTTVTKFDHIREWITTISKSDFELLQNKLKDFENYGIPKKIDLKCKNCGHEWTNEFKYNPVDFFA